MPGYIVVVVVFTIAGATITATVVYEPGDQTGLDNASPM